MTRNNPAKKGRKSDVKFVLFFFHLLSIFNNNFNLQIIKIENGGALLKCIVWFGQFYLLVEKPDKLEVFCLFFFYDF